MRDMLKAVVLACGFFGSSVAFAGITAGPPGIYVNQPWEAPPAETPRGIGEYQGLAQLSGRGRTLHVIRPRASTQIFLVGRTRFFDADGQPVSRGVLQDGDRVTVDFDYVGNTAIARRVTIGSSR